MNASFFLLRTQIFYLGLQIVLRVWNPIHPWVLLWVNLGDPCETLCSRPYPRKTHISSLGIQHSLNEVIELLAYSWDLLWNQTPLEVCCFFHSSYWTFWFSGSFVYSCLGLKILLRVVHSDSLTLHNRSFWKELWICNSIWF